jgi:FkbM family methyltransferase
MLKGVNRVSKIAVWGTGTYAERLIQENILLRRLTDFFIDSNSSKKGQLFYEKEVYNPDDIKWEFPPIIIIATNYYYNEIKEYLIEKGLTEGKDFFPRGGIYKLVDFLKIISKVEKWLPDIEKKILDNIKNVMSDLQRNKKRPIEIILEYMCNKKEKTLKLLNGNVMEYEELHEFSVIFEEILLEEEYYFETKEEVPVIIDGGANIGMAIFYFKVLYPKAKVIAFEPVQELCEIINRNIERNQWQDVTVFPYALSDRNEKTTFFLTESSLAGSLTERCFEGAVDKNIKKISVQCDTLGKYIENKVDYLKLDIEGSETKVIIEIGEKLKNIKHIFVEYHEGKFIDNNSLGKILCLLDKYGFDYHISKSLSFAKSTKYKPMTFVGNKISELIWAKHNCMK